jgi:hypothetical protein
MAIQYYMRAFNTTLVKYVDWVVNDAPDSTGTFSGYPTNQLINITVNKVVQSRVENFLKQNQSLGGTDGYYFHVNSYDWRNTVTPIAPPTNLVGFAVERGVSSVSGVSSASNTSPIVVTSSGNHGLETGQTVTINGVTGNTATNGSWPIIKLSDTSFSLTGSVGNGTFTGGGNIFIPSDKSSLTWDEANDVWRLVTVIKNNVNESVTLGFSQSLKVNNFIVDGYIAVGLDPADTGVIRLSNDSYIFSESNPSGTDIQLIGADTANRIKLGSLVTDVVYTPGVYVADGYVQHDGLVGNTAASTGFIREINNTNIVAFKNVTPSFSDVVALSSNTFNNVVLGDSVNTGTIYNTQHGSFNITAATSTNPIQITISTPASFVVGQSVYINGITGTIGSDPTNGLNFSVHGRVFQIASVINSTQFTLTGTNGVGLAYTSGGSVYTNSVHQFRTGNTATFEIGINQANSSYFARFPNNAIVPLIYQATAPATISGQNFIIQSQNAGLGGTNGGNLTLTTGTGVSNGVLNLQTGGVSRVTLSDTTETHIHQTITFANTVSNPIITQNTTTAAPGTTLTVQAQATSLGASRGGDLALSSGVGTSFSGEVFIQTGGLTQIVVSPETIAPSDGTFGPPTTGTVIIKGNLEVQGAMTTVESTTVDIIGRVLHGNWADPLGSPNVARPTQNVGYSIHRGNVSSQPRDGAAWIWTEGALDGGADGYWRAVTIHGDGYGTDNFNITHSPNIVGVMGAEFSASLDPAPIPGYLAASGSLRTPNNVPVAVSRNITATTTVAAASNLAALPQATINVVSTTRFTTAGTILVLSSAGVQTITYTGVTATSFTGCVGGTGTIITGSIVGQTNNSTTIAAGSNGAILPQATINVVSTTGFPTAGTIRVYSTTSTGGIQNIDYTGVTATSFTGCTVSTLPGSTATGTLNTGNIVTSIPPTGTQDLVLLGTDFGNRILHGSPTNNTGHIFNTTTGSFYDFQINTVSQVQLRGDVDGDSFTRTITIAPTVSTPKLYQVVRPDTGANNGFNLGVFAQAGQQQTGGNANNNGGNLVIGSGAAGTGGGGAAGTHGSVDIQTGGQLKVRIFPTDANPTGSSIDDNSVLYFESLFRVDSAQVGIGPLAGTGIRFRQDDIATASATGQIYTIQAQNATGATSTGGLLALTSGTGTTVAGDVSIQTGAVPRIIVHPTFSEFRDASEALRITPVSAGTTQITYASTVTSAQINHTITASTPSAPMTIQSQVTSAASGLGGNLILIAGNATGTTSTGGNAILTSGTGTTVAGDVQLQTGGVDKIIVHPTFTEFRDTAEALRITPVSAGTTQFTYASTVTAAQINQTTTGSATGATMTVQSQNAATTGGNLVLTSGTGATTAGNVNIQTGGVTKISVNPTFTTFNDTVEAYRITPVSSGATTLEAVTTATSVTYRQADLTTASGTGATTTIQAQNETGTTSTGGNLVLTSGTGTTIAGSVIIQTGGTARITTGPTSATLNLTNLQFSSSVVNPLIRQNDDATNAITGDPLTVQAQNATGTTTVGGELRLTSGSGTTTNGAVVLQVAGTTTASVVTNKFVFNRGTRRNVTAVTGTYQVLATDDFLSINTIAAPFTITMPATPTLGDTYKIKDAVGGAAANNVTISGNGVNIDGTASIVLSQNYAAVELTYTGTQWSVS